MYGTKDLLSEDMLALSIIDDQDEAIEEDHTFGDKSNMELWSPDSCDLPLLTEESFEDSLFSFKPVISKQDSTEAKEDTKDSEVHQIHEVSEQKNHVAILKNTGNLDSTEESENSSQSEGGTRRGRPKEEKKFSKEELSEYLKEVLIKHILKINQEIDGKRFTSLN
jgi:hypothetical protein